MTYTEVLAAIGKHAESIPSIQVNEILPRILTGLVVRGVFSLDEVLAMISDSAAVNEEEEASS